jgi:hypothetical protein
MLSGGDAEDATFYETLLNFLASAESSDDGARSAFEACRCKRCVIDTPRTLRTLYRTCDVSRLCQDLHSHAQTHSISHTRSYLL